MGSRDSGVVAVVGRKGLMYSQAERNMPVCIKIVIMSPCFVWFVSPPPSYPLAQIPPPASQC